MKRGKDFGNTLLKFAESWITFFSDEIKDKVNEKLSYKIGAELMKPVFDDLKAKLTGVIVAIIAVVFVGLLVETKSPSDVLYYGVGAGAVVLSLAAFSFATRKK